MDKLKTGQNTTSGLSSYVPEVENEYTGFGGRLRVSRETVGVSRVAAASTVGVSLSTFQAWEAGGREPDASKIAAYCKNYMISVQWLLFGEGPMLVGGNPAGSIATNEHEPVAHDAVSASVLKVMDTQGNPVCLEEFAFIPRYNLKASAGYGASTDGEKPLFTMAFRKYWIDNYLRCQPSDLSVISVKGDSMEGVLNDRDVILINHTDNDPGTGLYVLRMDGDLIVKRVQRIPGGKIKVTSANTAYEPFEVDLANLPNDFSIIGRVVWFGRQI